MISSYYRSTPYIRVFASHADADGLVSQYVEQFDGRVAYEFDIERLGDIKVIGMESPSSGNVSVVVTDHFDALPAMLQRTRVVYEVESVAQTLAAVRKAGIAVLQEETPVPVGYQGRFELTGGYVIELAAFSPEGLRFKK